MGGLGQCQPLPVGQRLGGAAVQRVSLEDVDRERVGPQVLKGLAVAAAAGQAVMGQDVGVLKGAGGWRRLGAVVGIGEIAPRP